MNQVIVYRIRAIYYPGLSEVGARREFAAVVPISAAAPVETLKEVAKHLPESMHFFPEDQLPTRARFMAVKLVREKVIVSRYAAALPMTVEIESPRTGYVSAYQRADSGGTPGKSYCHRRKP